MNIYIAYKYRRVDNKKALKEELQAVSEYLKGLGHSPFILGRDVQKWQEHGYSKFKTLRDIVRHIGKNDVLFVYINSNVHSNGIPVEFGLAKVLGLKTFVARKKGLNKSLLEFVCDDCHEFLSHQDLFEKLKNSKVVTHNKS